VDRSVDTNEETACCGTLEILLDQGRGEAGMNH